MKPTLPCQTKVVILAILVWVTFADAAAQRATDKHPVDQQVIAITPKGSVIRAPTHLRVNVQVLASPPILLISLENSHQRAREVIIHLRDSHNIIIHRIRSYEEALATKLDLSELETGIYQVEVANKYERYKYELQIKSKMVRSMEVNPQALVSTEPESYPSRQIALVAPCKPFLEEQVLLHGQPIIISFYSPA